MSSFFAWLSGAVRRSSARLAVAPLLALLIAGMHVPCGDRQTELRRKINELEGELQQLKNETSIPALVLSRHRKSICFIYGVYSFAGRDVLHRKERTQFSGTGFVVAEGIVATNRHVAEPWFEDEEAESLIHGGAKPKLDKLLAFFPDHRNGIELSGVVISPDADVAVARFPTNSANDLAPLPLAETPGVPGDPVIVVGYPMGIAAMVAKSPRPVFGRLAFRRADITVANELAALSLIRPSATQGHLGDVVGDKLIYDAVTAHGGSGGPVFNNQGRVIGVNSAYLDGFSGGTLGISINALRPVIALADQKH